ncbi:MAG: hypothetical protein WCB74_28610 [Pseudolabrys sp.]
MNLIRGYIGFVGLLVSIIGFMILAYAWADGTNPFIGWVVTGVGVLMWLQCLPMLRREDLERET